jgi:iron complex outermembrane receptor protein
MTIATVLRYGGGLLLLNGLASIAAFAQTAEGGLQEVIVTAQKRAQNVQDVPIAISAFTQQDLAERGVTEVSQLQNFTPNVHLDFTSPFGGSSTVLTAFIRGIGQDDFAFNLEPGVGVYLDGVYLARTIGANTDMLDVDHIEVLKGPQGTLFGQNTIGGAISIVTRRPSDEFGFKGELTGGSFSRMDVRAAIDLPLIANRLLSTISVSTKKRDGYQNAIPFESPTAFVTDPQSAFSLLNLGSSGDLGGQNSASVRGKLLWLAGEMTDVTFTADYTTVDQPSVAHTVLQASNAGISGLYNTCISTSAADLNTMGLGALCGPRGLPGTAQLPGIAGAQLDPSTYRLTWDNRFLTPDIDSTYSTGQNFDKESNFGFSLIVDRRFSDDFNLKSISAYRQLQARFGIDQDGSPLQIVENSFETNQTQLSQELQLSGVALNDRLSWVGGLYFIHEQGDLTDYVVFPAGLLQVFGPNNFENETYAAYTHLNYSITDPLTLTVGLRYSHQKKEFFGGQRDLNLFSTKLGTPADLFPTSDLSLFYPPGPFEKTFSNVSPRIGFDYKLTSAIMAYASWAKGFKSGGWTTRLSSPWRIGPGYQPFEPSFDEEEASTYELGLKSELLNRSLLLNAAVFTTQYEGIQLNVQEFISPTLQNAGDAKIKGAELESTWLATDDFRVSLSVGYLDSQYDSIAPTAQLAGLTLEKELPKAPRWSASLSPSYTIQLPNQGRLVPRIDYSYTSEQENDTINTPLLHRPEVSLVDASIAYTTPDDKWQIVAGGTNLTDKRYIVSGQDNTGAGLVYGTYNAPRQWFVSLRLNP